MTVPPKRTGRAAAATADDKMAELTSRATDWMSPVDAVPATPTFPPSHLPGIHPDMQPGTPPAGPVVHQRRAAALYRPHEPRGYVLKYPPPPGDGQVKVSSTIWAAQRDWLKQAALDHRTTSQDLVREAIDDLRAKLEGGGQSGNQTPGVR